ncbi:MAG: hypothetical protein OQJ97_05305 [Rhodospirillales bacterium]|nr:hypothetical protein [Rhodospirillales bacterium]
MISRTTNVDEKVYGEWSETIRKTVLEVICPSCQKKMEVTGEANDQEITLCFCSCEDILSILDHAKSIDDAIELMPT